MNDKTKEALNSYSEYGVKSEIDVADPHRLVQMLFDGALKRINLAKVAMKAKQIEKKGNLIGEVTSIIGGLKDTLNMEAGGEVAQNLASLYDYIENRLVMANASNSIGILDEVGELLLDVKEGWDGINRPAGVTEEVAEKLAVAEVIAEEKKAAEIIPPKLTKPLSSRSNRALKAYGR